MCVSAGCRPPETLLLFLLVFSDHLPALNPAKPQQSMKKLVSMAGRLLQAPSHIWLIPGRDTNLHGERVYVHLGALLFEHTEIPWTQIPPHAIHTQPMQPLVCFPPCQSDTDSTRFPYSTWGQTSLSPDKPQLLLALTSLKNSFTASQV